MTTTETASSLAQEIEINRIVPSPLPSQVRRRQRFDQNKLHELAESIKRHGVINPITVRPVSSGFEVVAGERRFLAAWSARLDTVPAIVRELNDSDAAEIQLIENGQRVDQHPIDEAFDYLDMQTVLGYDIDEIALRVGKPVPYVQNRIKLTTLAPAVREELESEFLPLGHALEIAKYPQADHEAILHLAIIDNYQGRSVRVLTSFIDQIKTQFLHQLKRAPFSTKSEALRVDGLACVHCPERSMATPLLFQDYFDDEDHCLNKTCWQLKTTAHIELQRKRIAEKAMAETGESPENVPLLTESYWGGKKFEGDEPVLGQNDYRELTTMSCDYAVKGVFADGSRVGQSQLVCVNQECVEHFGHRSRNIAIGNASNDDDMRSESRLIRKEEIFDSKVAEAVRVKVLKKAAEIVSRSHNIFELISTEWEIRLLSRLWYLQKQQSTRPTDVICEILGAEGQMLRYQNREGLENELAGMSKQTRHELLFLLLFAFEGEILTNGWFWQSQSPIKELANAFGINYKEVDAQERINQAPMKLKELYRSYQESIEAGHDAFIPRPFSGKWNPKD